MSFDTGVRAFMDGLRLSRDPKLIPYTLVPALLSFAVLGTGTWLAFDYAATLGAGMAERLPSWLGWLESIVVPLLYVLALVLAIWFFGLLTIVIASPFLGNLSLAVERKVFGSAPEEAVPWWQGISEALMRELRKLGYHLPRLLGVFVITLIPLVNAAAPVIWLLFGAWTMAIQFVDYAGENRHQPFRDTEAKLRAHRAAALGFGVCVAVALAIPLLNFVLIPVAVAGGTLLWRVLDGQSTPADQP